MVELFQITGSASFAARAALEETGAEYAVVDVHPRRRDEIPAFAEVNPLKRVPALRDGDVTVYETGAVLLHIGDRFPDARLAPPVGDPARPELYRWILWLADTLHPAWWPLQHISSITADEAGHPGVRAKGEEDMAAHGAYLEAQLAGREWCLGDRFSVADVYLYMLTGWESYVDGFTLGGPNLRAHYARVGARPAIARARELEDLDERLLRHHPELRGGRPI
jgi:glutathione S-transferase